MSAVYAGIPSGRYAQIGEVCDRARNALGKLMLPIIIVVGLETLYLKLTDSAGAEAFALIGGSTCAAVAVWRTRAVGLPLLPLMAFQALMVYGIPIVAGHESLTSYPAQFAFEAGLEVLIFNVAMTVVWWLCMQIMHPSPAVSFALREFNQSSSRGMMVLGFGLLGASTLFLVLQGLVLLDALYELIPNGGVSILTALVSVLGACGLFLVSMAIGAGDATPLQRASFWVLLVFNTIIAADGFILAAAGANLVTAGVGLFWGSGRVPWGYLTIALLGLAFLNVGKVTMRERYWGDDDTPAAEITLQRLPAVFSEWCDASYQGILENNSAPTGPTPPGGVRRNKNQTLLDRIDNLQNLLFVIDAIKTDHVPTLKGASYAIIPPLLVPRVLWPEKPRSHEGQIMLNVHFGRQDLESTLKTYIAWGLLPEAYGNFGAVWGSVGLGACLGAFFAWIENLTARKLVVSMEGFLSLCLLFALMNSFEMVSSVLVTSIFQSMLIVVGSCAMFVERTVSPKAP